MCLDIKNFYLTAALEYFEYMKTPLALFPAWTVEQYNLRKLALDGWVHIEMRRAVWGLPQAGILANPPQTGAVWVLREHQHTWSVEAQILATYLHSRCRQLWGQVC